MARSLPPTHRREESPLVRVGRRYRGGQRRARAPRGRAQGALRQTRPRGARARLAKYRDLSRRADRVRREYPARVRRRPPTRALALHAFRRWEVRRHRRRGARLAFHPAREDHPRHRRVAQRRPGDNQRLRRRGVGERSLPPPSSRAPRDGKRTAAGSGPTIGITGTTMDASSTSGTTSGERLRDDRAASARSRVRPSRR